MNHHHSVRGYTGVLKRCLVGSLDARISGASSIISELYLYCKPATIVAWIDAIMCHITATLSDIEL